MVLEKIQKANDIKNLEGKIRIECRRKNGPRRGKRQRRQKEYYI